MVAARISNGLRAYFGATRQFVWHVPYVRLVLAPLAVTCFLTQAALAQSPNMAQQLEALQRALGELSAKVENQQNRITSLESENEALKRGTGAVPVAGAQDKSRTSSVGPAREIGLTGSVPTDRPRSAQFNPDIGFVVDVVAKLTESDEDSEGNDRVSVRHAELVLGHDVDPYSRIDSVIAFSDEHGVELEEAVLTHWGLPWGTKGRFGRFRPRIGPTNSVHVEQLDSVDVPLMVARYLGEEGYFKSGVEFSNFLPFTWENPASEVLVGLLEGGIGEEGSMFGSTRRRPTFYARLRHGIEVGGLTDLELGNSFLLGSADEDSKNEVRAFTADLTLIHRFNSINRLKLQAEAMVQDRTAGFLGGDGHDHGTEPHAFFLRDDDDHDDDHHDDDDHHGDEAGFRENPYGLYLLADYRLSQQFSMGGRFDAVQAVNTLEGADRSTERAYSAWLTFHQSEFARWRFQYQYLEDEFSDDDNRFFFQGTFAIGVHRHQLG